MGCTTSESQGLCFCRICTSKHLCLFPLYSQLHTYLICYEETRYRAINLRKIPHRKKKCLFYFNSLARAAGPNNSLLVSWQLITLCSCWESLEIFYHSHTFVGSWRKQGNSRKKTSISASGSTTSESARAPYLKNLTLLEKTYLPCETSMRVKKQVGTRHGKRTGSKLGKEYHKAIYCHLAYLTSMQSTSCKMPGWMNGNN